MFLRSNTHALSLVAPKVQVFLAISCTLMLCIWTAPVSAELPDHDEIRRLLSNTKPEVISYDVLRTYFDILTGIDSTKIGRSRLFPLCISTPTLEAYTPLQAFAPIWKEMDKQIGCESRPLYFYEYNATLHSMHHNKDWIDTLQFSRINTPEVDVRNLRQWMHIKVKAKKPLQALYMQPIVGSLGLPSGEFSLEFPCSDIVGGDTSDQDSMLFHCDFRPRTELNHPLVYFGGYAGLKPMTEFHVHYKWTDISCLETPFLQFILIAVKDFKKGSSDAPKWGEDFQPLLSPVYTNIDFDTIDGATTPYYIDWKNSMSCFKTAHDMSWINSTKLYHDTVFESLKWNESNFDRLIVNEDFDECIRNNVSKDRDEDRKECSPGPLECSEKLSLKTVIDKTSIQDVVARRQKEFEDVQTMAGCFPCVFPRKEDVLNPSCVSSAQNRTQPTVQKKGRSLDPYLYLDYSMYLNIGIDSRFHGALATFVYLVITPIGILIARFYRGTPVHRIHKDDFWVGVHACIHLLGLHLLWISLGFVSTMDEGISSSSEHCFKDAEDIRISSANFTSNWTQASYMDWMEDCSYKSRKNTHAGLGIFSFVLHNLNIILSFFRSHDDSIRNIQVIIHSHLGYLDLFVSIFTIYTALEGQHCNEVFAYSVCTCVFIIMAFWCASCVTDAEDKKLGIEPPRYKWPILEPVRVAHAGPCYETKLAILGVFAGVLLFVWVVSLAAIARLTSSEISVWSDLNNDDTETRIIGGLFKACKISNVFRPKLDEF